MRRISALALLLPTLTGCPDAGGQDTESAKAAVEQAFAAANPPGRTGAEMRGHTVWMEAPFFEKSCLEKNDLAFNDEPRMRPPGSPPRVSPTYQAQRFITESSEDGFCVYLGDDPKIEVTGSTWAGEAYRVTGTVTMSNPTKWFECLDTPLKNPEFMVKLGEDGKPLIEGDLVLPHGKCSSPLPEGEARGPGKKMPNEAHKAPSKAEVVKLATALDDALFERDLAKVQELTACYNLEDAALPASAEAGTEKPTLPPPLGNCSVGEFVSLGHAFHGEQRAQDGTPWTEYAVRDLDEIRRIVPDGKIKNMAHATMVHKRTGRDRSFSVQWIDGKWRMVGVIGRKAESLTTVRYVYDLHRPDKRDVFLRRLDGENIDEDGNPPFEDEMAQE